MHELPLTCQYVRSLLDYRDYRTLRLIFKDSEAADIGEIFSELDISECIVLFRLVPRLRRPDLFSYLEIERQEELLEEFPDVIVSKLLNEMEPDNRTRLLESVSEAVRNKVLLRMNPEERQVAARLLSYPEGSVGRIMTSDCLSLNYKMRVSEALEYIHWSTSVPVDYLHHLFVVGDDGYLMGEVSLASLVVCDPVSKPIVEIMRRNYVSLLPEDEASAAVEILRKYDRYHIPVVDDKKLLLGLVTADDLFDVAEEEATEDIQQFGGQGALEESYFQTPILTMLKKRVGWLAFLFVGGFISVSVLQNYQDQLSKWGFLTAFLTIIISTGGNSGTQAASLIIRGFAINELRCATGGVFLGASLLSALLSAYCLVLVGLQRQCKWATRATLD